MIEKLRNIFSKHAGQALVEYAMLLALTTLTITAFLNMDDQMKLKVQTVAEDFETDLILLPDPEPPIKPERDLELSPPVAQFTAPNPNYKGREILFTDSSYDVDGYVEHWRWTIDGKQINKTKSEIEKDGGLIYSFRNVGVYPVSLYVFDNDGLVSNVVSTTVEVINRNPTLSVMVQNEQGQRGTSITVPQMCTATFFTEYTDPDLPYDELKLYSRFVDHTGVPSEDNSAPHQFTRQFVNLGTNTYTVTVTDENGASVTQTVTATVVTNPSGQCGGVNVEKPKYKIIVTDQNGKAVPPIGNIYEFEDGERATLTASVVWGTYQAHQTAYYFKTTQNNQTTYNKWQVPISMKYPLNTDFKMGDKPTTVLGMARDMSATSDSPSPSLAGMSNQDTVILRVKETQANTGVPIAIISHDNKKDPSNTKPETIFDVSKEKNKFVEITVESIMSSVDPKDKTTNLKGVRWKLPNGTWKPVANEANAFYDPVVKKWFYNGKVNSPDSKVKMNFVAGKSNTWVYELEVINSISKVGTTKKTYKISDSLDEKPKAVCSPDHVKSNKGAAIQMNAAKSSDDKGTVTVRWSLDNFDKSVSGWQAPTANVPSNSTWNNLAVGTHKIYLEVKDNANQTAKAECKVTIEEVTDVRNKIRPELNYIENRVRFASSQSIPFINRTNVGFSGFNLKDIHYTAWTESLYTSDSGTTGEKLTVNHVGASNSNSVSDNPHTSSSKIIITNSTAGAYRIYIWASDKDGRVQTADCVSGKVERKTVNGESIEMCGKGTFYFRFGKATASGVTNYPNVSNEQSSFNVNWTGHHRNWPSVACHKISKSMSTYNQYYQAYQGGGSWDQFGEVYVDGRIKYMLRAC